MLTLPHGDTEKRCLIARSYLKSTIVFSSAQDYALLQSMSLILAPLLVSWGCHNKFPQACRLKTFIFLQFWKPKLSNRGVGQAAFPPLAIRQILVFSTPNFEWLQVFLGLWSHHSNLCFCGHTTSPLLSNLPCVSLS